MEWRHRLTIAINTDPGTLDLRAEHDVIVSLRIEALICNLPAAADAGIGRCYGFRSASRGPIRIRAAGTETITGLARTSGAADILVATGTGISLISDGKSAWYAISDLGQ